MNQTVRTKKIIGTVLIAVFVCILMKSATYMIRLGTTNFDARLGLFGSPEVGMANVDEFKASPEYHKVMSNTFEMSAVSALVGAGYVFLLSMAIGSAKDRFMKAVLAVLFAIPAVIPVQILFDIFPAKANFESVELAKLFISITDGLRFAGLFSLVALFIRGNVLKESGKCVLIFVAIKLAMMLTLDFTTVMTAENPYNRYEMQNFVTLPYYQGIQGGEYSYASALDMVRTGIQILTGIVGCLILMLVYGEIKKSTQQCLRTDLQSENHTPKGFKWFAIAAIIPVVILVLAVITGGSLLPIAEDPSFTAGYQIEYKVALESALWVTAISFVLAVAARNTFRGVGFILLMLLLATGNNLVGKYILTYDLKIIDTVKGMVFYNLQMIPVFSLIMTCATYKDRSWKKDLTILVVGFLLMFGHFWGDYGSTSVMTSGLYKEIRSFSYILRIMRGGSLDSISVLNSVPNSTLLYIIIPVAAVAVGMLGCAFLNYNKKKSLPTVFEQAPSFASQQPLYPNQQPVYAGQPTVMPQQVGVSPQEDIVEPKSEPVENSTTPLQ